MNDKSDNIKILLKNVKPHEIYYKLYVNGNKISKKQSFNNVEKINIELREYNLMLDKAWWVWHILLLIPAMFLGTFIWEDIKPTQRIITLLLTNITSDVSININSEASTIMV